MTPACLTLLAAKTSHGLGTAAVRVRSAVELSLGLLGSGCLLRKSVRRGLDEKLR